MFAKTMEITEPPIFMDKVEMWGRGEDGLLTSCAMESIFVQWGTVCQAACLWIIGAEAGWQGPEEGVLNTDQHRSLSPRLSLGVAGPGCPFLDRANLSGAVCIRVCVGVYRYVYPTCEPRSGGSLGERRMRDQNDPTWAGIQGQVHM